MEIIELCESFINEITDRLFCIQYELNIKIFYEKILKLCDKHNEEICNVYILYGSFQNYIRSAYSQDLLVLVQSEYYKFDYINIDDKIESINTIYNYLEKIKRELYKKYC
jgi:hypothetical protein